MKKSIIILSSLLTVITTTLKAQTNSNGKEKMVLIEIDTKGLNNEPNFDKNLTPVTEITRLELDKLNIYQVVNQYDLDYMVKDSNINISNCFSSYCIAQVAKKLNCEKVFTGNLIKLADKIVITFKVYDAKSNIFEKQIVKEYLNVLQQIPFMLKAAIREMYNIPVPNEDIKSITDKFEFDDSRNNPTKSRLRSDGPRMGLTYFTGHTAELISASKQNGGFNAQPLMFQFGYQFEKQYLNEGNFQALFEFAPMVTGLDQGLFIPSFTLMNGMRNNKNGWEFAFGPSVSLVTKAKGFYNNQNQWQLAKDTAGMLKKPFIEHRLDSRGEPELQWSFVFAFGKTFKSGKLNIPVNAYFIPSNEGYRFGVSFGFNSRARFENVVNN